MRSDLFCDFTRRTVVRTDFSWQSIGPIFKNQAVFLDKDFVRKLSKNQLFVCWVATIIVNSGHISVGSSQYFFGFV
jgi:hypothetical protein